MEREKVIELAEKAGFKYPKEITENPEWSTYADRMHSRLQEFALLVELETLERAGHVCDLLVSDAASEYALASKPEVKEYWSGAKDQMLRAGGMVRKLKGNP